MVRKIAVAVSTFSHYLQKKLNTDYHSISTLFSGAEGVILEQYLILQRIDKVKELLTYGELAVGQIAEDINYIKPIPRSWINIQYR